MGTKRRTVLAYLVPRVQVQGDHLLLFDSGHQASLDLSIEAGHAHRDPSRSPTLILRVTTAIEPDRSSSLRGEGRPDHLLLRRRRALRVGRGEVHFLLSASCSPEVGNAIVSLASKHLVEAFLGGTRTRRRETKFQRSPHYHEFVNCRRVDQSMLYLQVLVFALNLVRVQYLPNGQFKL